MCSMEGLATKCRHHKRCCRRVRLRNHRRRLCKECQEHQLDLTVPYRRQLDLTAPQRRQLDLTVPHRRQLDFAIYQRRQLDLPVPAGCGSSAAPAMEILSLHAYGCETCGAKTLSTTIRRRRNLEKFAILEAMRHFVASHTTKYFTTGMSQRRQLDLPVPAGFGSSAAPDTKISSPHAYGCETSGAKTLPT